VRHDLRLSGFIPVAGVPGIISQRYGFGARELGEPWSSASGGSAHDECMPPFITW
jgi:hypothetical protein